MKLISIEATNFLSYESMKLDLDNKGLVLIEGVNRSNNSYESNGSGKCLAGSQRIYDTESNEYVPIRDFVIEKRKKTLGLVDYKLKDVDVIDWFSLGKKKVYKLTSNSGSSIIAAGTHPFVTSKGVIKLEDLEEGDWVAEARKLPVRGEKEKFTEDTWFALGALIGDGYLAGKGSTIKFTNSEPEIFERVLRGVKHISPYVTYSEYRKKGSITTDYRFINDNFDAKNKFYGDFLTKLVNSTNKVNKEDKIMFKTLVSDLRKGKGASVERVMYFSDSLGLGESYNDVSKIINPVKHLKRFLSGVGLTVLSGDKSLRGLEVDDLTNSDLANLLAGLFSTDGEIPRLSDNAVSRIFSWSYTSKSESLVDDIKRILLRFGVKSQKSSKVVSGCEYFKLTTLSCDWENLINNINLVGDKNRRVEEAKDYVKYNPIKRNTNRDVIPKDFNSTLPTYSADKKQHRTRGQLEKHSFSREAFINQGGDPKIGESDIYWTKIKNIEYIGEEDCFDITVDTDEHLYVAENFIVHNSALLDSITYALFDKTMRGLKADDVVNRNVGKNTSVILNATVGDDKYRIERYRKHTKNKNKVKLFLNDKEITGKSASATNKMIEDLFGISFETYANSIMFGQGEIKMFSQATDKEKKEILENIINLSVYGKAQEIAKKRLHDKQADISAEEHQIEKLQWSLENVDNLEKQDKESYQNTLNLIKEQQDNIKKIIDEKEAYVLQNIKVNSDNEKTLERLKKERDELGDQNGDSSTMGQKVNESYKSLLNVQSEVNAVVSEKESLVKKYKDLKTKTNCPVCGSPLDSTHREQELQSIQEQLKQVLMREKTLTQQYNLQNTEYSALYEEYQKVQSEVAESNQKYTTIVNQINAIEQANQQYVHGLRSFDTRLEQTKEYLERLREVPEPKSRDSERDNIKKQIKELRDKISIHLKEISKLEDVSKMFSNTGIKSHVLDLVTPYLNERANHYLSALSGSDIEITFTTQKKNKDGSLTDKFDVEINNVSGGENYQANSVGEKRRIDLSISLAIQDLVMSKANLSTNLVVYDEVFDGLDAIGCENVITLLKERLKNIGTIFVITHSQHLKPLFGKVITVQKENKVSTIKEGLK